MENQENQIRRLSSEMQYVLLPGKLPPQHLTDYYKWAYLFWKKTWTDALIELEGSAKLFADEFTRQDEVGSIFHNGECISTVFYNWLDMSAASGLDDSYFKVWPKEAVDALTQFGKRIIVCSYFTLHKDYRQSSFGINMKDVVMGLIVKRYQDTDAPGMTGTMRNNRGMNECTYRFGAEPIAKNLAHHGVEVDLVGFYQSKVHECQDKNVNKLVSNLWESRTVYNLTRLRAAA